MCHSADAVPIGMRSEAIQAADGLKIPHIGQAVAEVMLEIVIFR